jgi:hypothetical protein
MQQRPPQLTCILKLFMYDPRGWMFNKCSYKNYMLEPVCCKKQQKKSSWPVTGLWNRGPLKILNGIKLILDDQGNHLDSYTISLESFRSFRGPLFCKPVTGQKLFFAVSYSKPTLEIENYHTYYTTLSNLDLCLTCFLICVIFLFFR